MLTVVSGYKKIECVKCSIVTVLFLVLLLLFGSCSAPGTEPNGLDTEPDPEPSSEFDPQEEWWLKVQSYTYLTDIDQMLSENSSVVWWGNGLTSPEKIRTEIKDEIDDCHDKSIRYIVPISLFDIEDHTDLSVIKEVSAAMMQAAVLKLDGSPYVILYNFGGDPDATQYAYDINHPDWRQYIKEQALAAVDAGADGINIDDINGNRWWVENGWGSFNPSSEAGFRDYLKNKYSIAELSGIGIADIDSFDYSDFLAYYGWTVDSIRLEEYPYHAAFPLYDDFFDFQAKATAEFADLIMQTAKEYAQQQYGRKLMVTECCEYRDCTAKYIRPYFNALSAGALYGKERYWQHIAAYKLVVAVNSTPMIAWLGDTEALMSHYDIADLYSIYIAESYANKAQLVAFPGRGSPAEYNDFILSHSDIFDFADWESKSRIGLLYSLTTMAGEEFYSQTHSQFFNLGQLLNDSQYQYDVVFSHGDDLTVERLAQYDVVILPATYALASTEKEALLSYCQGGGRIIYIGETDVNPSPFSAEQGAQAGIIYEPDWVARLDLYGQHIQYQAMVNLSLALPQFYQPLEEQPPPMNQSQVIADFTALIDGNLSKRTIRLLSESKMGLVMWDNKGKLNLHIINYDLDYSAAQINEKSYLAIEVDAELVSAASTVTLVSPDYAEPSILPFSIEDGFISFTVPSLHVWGIIVIE